MFRRKRHTDAKRLCLNCEKENCILGKCKEPLNLKTIALNLERFKRDKAKRTSNKRWKSKRINITELQPSTEEWFDVYETVISEGVSAEHNFDQEEDADDQDINACRSTKTKAFQVAQQPAVAQTNSTIVHAFQTNVGNGDPDVHDTTFTSLFDMMVTPPSMKTDRDDYPF